MLCLCLLAVLVVVVLAVAFLGERLFYYPARGESGYGPQNLGLAFEEVSFASRDGTQLHGWFMPAVGESKGTVLHVHGNAGKLEHHLDMVAWLPPAHWNVLMFDYRGYGLSEDKRPTPRGLMEDTQAALAWLRGRADLAPENILVLGQSLGGNNAIAALALPDEAGERAKVAGLVVDATFESYSAIASTHVPFLGRLLRDDYSADRHLPKLAGIPLLFLHGEVDMLIPWQHSQRLFALALAPKQLHIVPGAGHIRALQDAQARQEVLRFFEACLPPSPPLPTPLTTPPPLTTPLPLSPPDKTPASE